MVSRKDLLAGTAAVPKLEASAVPQGEARVRLCIGLAWFRREDYPRILELMEDRKEMHDTYEEWLRGAEGLERHLVDSGQTARRIIIDPDVFRAWCEQHNIRPEANARTRYAVEATRAMTDNEDRQRSSG